MNAINLVFCNQCLNKDVRERLKNTVIKANNDVPTILIESYYKDNGTKFTPQPEPKNAYNKIIEWTSQHSE